MWLKKFHVKQNCLQNTNNKPIQEMNSESKPQDFSLQAMQRLPTLMMPRNTSKQMNISGLVCLKKLEPVERLENKHKAIKHNKKTRRIWGANTCKIIQNDQNQLLPKRRKQPSNQLSAPELNISDFGGMNSSFTSLGPFSNAMVMAPPTQNIVPSILAMLLKLRI